MFLHFKRNVLVLTMASARLSAASLAVSCALLDTSMLDYDRSGHVPDAFSAFADVLQRVLVL